MGSVDACFALAEMFEELGRDDRGISLCRSRCLGEGICRDFEVTLGASLWSDEGWIQEGIAFMGTSLSWA